MSHATGLTNYLLNFNSWRQKVKIMTKTWIKFLCIYPSNRHARLHGTRQNSTIWCYPDSYTKEFSITNVMNMFMVQLATWEDIIVKLAIIARFMKFKFKKLYFYLNDCRLIVHSLLIPYDESCAKHLIFTVNWSFSSFYYQRVFI